MRIPPTAPLFVVISFTVACDATPPAPPSSGVTVVPTVTSVAISPSRADGRAARSFRLTLSLGKPLASDATRSGRVLLVAGGASAADIAAIAAAKANAAIRARYVPLFAWQDAQHVYVQPSTPLDVGTATLVFLIDREPPFTYDVDVAEGAAPLVRAWPVGDARAMPDARWTYCADALPAPIASTATIDPGAIPVDVVARSEAPCVDLVARAPLPAGEYVPPPSLGDGDAAIAIDPSPVIVAPHDDAAPPDATCSGALALGPLCVRVDDDRVTFVGADTANALVLGSIGARSIVAPIVAGDRVVVRGLAPSSSLPATLVVRTVGEHRFVGSVKTLPPHPHLVVNEVLTHPPSTAATQRFVEIVDDGDVPASTDGIVLVDGSTRILLPTTTIAPNEIVLVTPEGFLDGFGGDVAPPANAHRIVLPATIPLKLTGEVSLLDGDGNVLSRFPGTTSTRTASRGRRTPDSPDDAPEAFGFDANGTATPGRPNKVE